MNPHRGFTLIEVLLVVGLMAIVATFSVPLGLNFYRLQSIEGARDNLLETLDKARHNAVLQKGDSRYGVYIDAMDDAFSSVTLYKGESFSEPGRDDSYDEIYTQAPGMTISASGTADLLVGDINFSKLIGTTTATGTITITHTGGGARSLTIDDQGNAHKQ